MMLLLLLLLLLLLGGRLCVCAFSPSHSFCQLDDPDDSDSDGSSDSPARDAVSRTRTSFVERW